jgi:regulator of protease activity HflC (stomatin/prohibitin superfamily)
MMFGIFLGIMFAVAILVAGFIFNQRSRATLGAAGVLVLNLVIQSFTIVPAGHVGVQITMGEVNQTVLTEGAQFVNPISNVKHVDVRLARANLNNASAGTKDIQQVHTDIVINYRLTPAKVPHIYKEFGLDVDTKVLGPAINESFKSAVGHYTSEELITKRDAVNLDIMARLSEKLAPFNIVVNNVSLVNFGFSKAYQDAIEQKVIATQAKLRADQDYERIQVEAKSRIAQAKGEAEAIAIQASAIQHQGGQAYVQLQWIEKWNGKMPDTVVNGGKDMMLNLGK